MALSARKKWALGVGITGLVFFAVAAVVWNTQVNPSWLTIGLPLVGLIGSALGLVITVPQLP